MTISLRELFTADSSQLAIFLYKNEIVIKEYITKNLHHQRLARVELANICAEKKLLSETDIKIVSMVKFQNIMVTNTYDRGIRYLQNYDTNYIDEKHDFPLKYENDTEMVCVYVGTLIDNDYYMENLDDFLFKMEKMHSRIWVVDMLLKLNPVDVNDDKNITYIDCMSVLKYIGQEKEFKDRFTRWIINYEESQFKRNMNNNKVLNDYLTEIVKYMPFLPNCLQVYKKLKFLTPDEYENDVRLICDPIYDITG